MAELHRAHNGTVWFEITCAELSGYSGMDAPICDECLKSLVACDHIVLIPIFNEAFCPECGKKRLSNIYRYPEDRSVEEYREKYWMDYFGKRKRIYEADSSDDR